MAVKYNCISIIMYPNDIFRDYNKVYKIVEHREILKYIDENRYNENVKNYCLDNCYEFEMFDLTECRRPPIYINLAVRSEITDALERICTNRPTLSYFVICHDKDEVTTRITYHHEAQTHFHVVLVDTDPNFKPNGIEDWWDILEVLGMDRYVFSHQALFYNPDGTKEVIDCDCWIRSPDSLKHRVQEVVYAGKMVRYLTHADRKDKAQYPKTDIVTNDLGMLHQFYYPEEASLAYCDMADLLVFHHYSMTQLRRWALKNNCIRVFDTHFNKLLAEMKEGSKSNLSFQNEEMLNQYRASEDQVEAVIDEDLKHFDGTYFNN